MVLLTNVTKKKFNKKRKKKFTIKDPIGHIYVFVKLQYFYSIYSYLTSWNKFLYLSFGDKCILLGYISLRNKVISTKCCLILKYFLKCHRHLCEYVELLRGQPAHFRSYKYCLESIQREKIKEIGQWIILKIYRSCGGGGG